MAVSGCRIEAYTCRMDPLQCKRKTQSWRLKLMIYSWKIIRMYVVLCCNSDQAADKTYKKAFKTNPADEFSWVNLIFTTCIKSNWWNDILWKMVFQLRTIMNKQPQKHFYLLKQASTGTHCVRAHRRFTIIEARQTATPRKHRKSCTKQSKTPVPGLWWQLHAWHCYILNSVHWSLLFSFFIFHCKGELS